MENTNEKRAQRAGSHAPARKKKRKWVVAAAAFLVLLVILTLGRACSRDSAYEEAFGAAQASYEAGAYEEAIRYLEEALALENTEEAYLLYADVYYYGLDDLDSAIDILYVGAMRLDSTAITERLEELKNEKQGLLNDGNSLCFGEVRVPFDARTAVLSGQALVDADLADIGRLTELESLTLSDNRITDLKPLTALTKLTTLYLENNEIRDLQPLTAMKQLRTLYLDGNPIEDFAPLHTLTNLTTLSLNGVEINVLELEELEEALPGCSIFCDEVSDEPVEITLGGVTFMSDVTELDLSELNLQDISELAKCKKLRQLDLSENQIADLSPLEELTELTWLSLWNNKVTDVRTLVGLQKLSYLDLDGNPLTNIQPLASLPTLRELWLSGCALGDHTPLGSLTGLQRLGLKNTGLADSDLEILKKLTKLTELKIENNPGLTRDKVEALKAALPGCTVTHDQFTTKIKLGGVEYESDATYIDASNAGVTSLKGLADFKNLKTLLLSGNQITDLSELKGLTNLEALELDFNGVRDLTPLSGLKKLRVLSLVGCSVTDLSALRGLPSLMELHLDYNSGLKDLSPIAGCTSLTELSAEYCAITDLSPLSGLTGLTYLNVEGNTIQDVTALHGLTKLQILEISYNNVDSQQIEALRQALPNCNVITNLNGESRSRKG